MEIVKMVSEINGVSDLNSSTLKSVVSIDNGQSEVERGSVQ